jgi:hypothetical protein
VKGEKERRKKEKKKERERRKKKIFFLKEGTEKAEKQKVKGDHQPPKPTLTPPFFTHAQ